MVDWVDFVQLHGMHYIAGLDENVPAVASDQLGAVVGRVECQLSVLKFQPGSTDELGGVAGRNNRMPF
ncbi:MAG: hypothetical protein ABJA74_14155 [Lapillicoccus sp.]